MVILSLKLVLRAGLEPTTLCLEGRCSIQLSYRSMIFQCSRRLPHASRASERIVHIQNGLCFWEATPKKTCREPYGNRNG